MKPVLLAGITIVNLALVSYATFEKVPAVVAIGLFVLGSSIHYRGNPDYDEIERKILSPKYIIFLKII